MRKIVVDTNFLLMPFEYGVDLAAELMRIIHGPITLIISSGTMGELETLAGRNGRRAAAARFVLQNMEKIKGRLPVEIAESSGKVDTWIINFATKNQIAVATNDVPLRKKLLAHKVPVIAMKSKAKLEFV